MEFLRLALMIIQIYYAVQSSRIRQLHRTWRRIKDFDLKATVYHGWRFLYLPSYHPELDVCMSCDSRIENGSVAKNSYENYAHFVNVTLNFQGFSIFSRIQPCSWSRAHVRKNAPESHSRFFLRKLETIYPPEKRILGKIYGRVHCPFCEELLKSFFEE